MSGVQRTKIERKSCALHKDFAREFVTRRFGEAEATLIYSLLPIYRSGNYKGLVKGFVCWDKVTEGGWVRDGYEQGHVERPGTRNVRIMESAFNPDGRALAAGPRYENETPEEREKYVREMLALIFGRDDCLRRKAQRDRLNRNRRDA